MRDTRNPAHRSSSDPNLLDDDYRASATPVVDSAGVQLDRDQKRTSASVKGVVAEQLD